MEGPAKYALQTFGFEGKCVLITGGSSGAPLCHSMQMPWIAAEVLHIFMHSPTSVVRQPH